jgi:predicted ATP-dependent serine protease
MYSDPGIGKTHLAIKCAQDFPQVAYIALDDVSGKQDERFNSHPNISLFNYQVWQKLRGQMTYIVEKEVDKTVEADSFSDFARKKSDRRKKILREFEIKKEKATDNLRLFEILMTNGEFDRFDLIVIDSLNAFFEGSARITRKQLTRLIEVFAEKNKTLLVLHHTNKKGEFSGSTAFNELFDSILKLEEGSGNLRILREEKRRANGLRRSITLEMVEISPNQADFIVQNESKVQDVKTEKENVEKRYLMR